MYLRKHFMEKSLRTLAPDWIKTLVQSDLPVRERLQRLPRAFRPTSRRVQPSLPPTDDPMAQRTRSLFDLECRYMWATSIYTLRPYRGRTALIWANEESDPTAGWKKVVENMHVYATPGTHFSSITTHAEAVAERMRTWLDAGVETTNRA
jgi:thioesterase domain-containing protein